MAYGKMEPTVSSRGAPAPKGTYATAQRKRHRTMAGPTTPSGGRPAARRPRTQALRITSGSAFLLGWRLTLRRRRDETTARQDDLTDAEEVRLGGGPNGAVTGCFQRPQRYHPERVPQPKCDSCGHDGWPAAKGAQP
jgi:hypothetical protein